MICEVKNRFNGIEEKRTFEVGEQFDFTDERAEYLASLGFVSKGAAKPAPKPKKKAKKDE